MSNIKPIRTEDDYREALELLETLITNDPKEGSEESDQTIVLSALIEDYENATFPDYKVDPIEAIRFRMEQLGLRSVDLAPYLGGKSRVSEVLSGKRALTVKMVKSLEEGLGIPASSLIGSAGTNASKRWTTKVVKRMNERGYFGVDIKAVTDDILSSFLNSMPSLSPALLRQTNYRDSESIDKQLLNAWLIKVAKEAERIIEAEGIGAWSNDSDAWINELIGLSIEDDGPLRAINLLSQHGVVVVIEPPLPNTRLDGAMMLIEGRVVIGLTLRHDRLDNFWFTLFHELSHAILHGDSDNIFFDNLESSSNLINDLERQADSHARDSMIPPDLWDRSPIKRNATPMIIKAFAAKHGVSEAIVAGRLRYESGQWFKYSSTVNGATVRHLFKEIVW